MPSTLPEVFTLGAFFSARDGSLGGAEWNFSDDVLEAATPEQVDHLNGLALDLLDAVEAVKGGVGLDKPRKAVFAESLGTEAA